MNKAICFYFPYHEDSGVPVLFYRMANEIAQCRTDLEIYVIDYKNGAMARNLLSLPNLHLIVFEKNKKVTLPKDSILVMQTFVPYYWPQELVLEPNQRLFFWNLHPQNLIPSLLPLPFLRDLPMNNFGVYKLMAMFNSSLIKKLRKYTQLLLDKEALYFMDKTNLDFTAKYLSLTINKKEYLPVPASSAKVEIITQPHQWDENKIKIGWVGRLCDFKSHILVYTINKIAEIAPLFPNKKFVYYVVGDGPYLDYIKRNIRINEQVEVVFKGALPHHQLDDFMMNNFDIVTAMGTSALEGAKLRKPTILLDPIFKPIKKDYVFRWLHNTKEYDLAHFINENDYKVNNRSLFEMLKNVLENYEIYAQKSVEYFDTNHSLAHVRDLFVSKLAQSKLTFSMIDSSMLKKGKLLTMYNKLRKLDS